MSYFGISGPAQDGGFVQGIHLGAARLHNARVDRQRHAKSLGNLVPGLFQDNQGYPSDSVLNERIDNFNDSYDNWVNTQRAIESGRLNENADGVEAIKNQYSRDRQLIADWAESGPYVHEGKAMGGAVLLAIAAIGGYYLVKNLRFEPAKKTKGAKSAMYAVFS